MRKVYLYFSYNVFSHSAHKGILGTDQSPSHHRHHRGTHEASAPLSVCCGENGCQVPIRRLAACCSAMQLLLNRCLAACCNGDATTASSSAYRKQPGVCLSVCNRRLAACCVVLQAVHTRVARTHRGLPQARLPRADQHGRVSRQVPRTTLPSVHVRHGAAAVVRAWVVVQPCLGVPIRTARTGLLYVAEACVVGTAHINRMAWWLHCCCACMQAVKVFERFLTRWGSLDSRILDAGAAGCLRLAEVPFPKVFIPHLRASITSSMDLSSEKG